MLTPDYTSQAQLRSIITEQDMAAATDDTRGEQFAIDEEIIDNHLAYAESRVESYLVEYDLEEVENNPPPVIIWAVTFIAAYTLFQRADLKTSEEVQQSYQEVMTWLEQVRAGEATIPGLDSFDSTFVGFGDTSTMIIDRVPHSDHIPTL